MKIKIKYFDNAQLLEKLPQGDWIDLRCNAVTKITANQQTMIPLGIAMELPFGFEAHIVPRSSTFKHYGIIQTNSLGVVDNSYKGDNDQWFMPVWGTRDIIINKGDRICQFRIMEKQPEFELETVESLENEDRGGFGSTGIN